MPQNSLTLVVDEQGMYYRIPICLINDPMNYDADFVNEKLKKKEAPKAESTLNVSFLVTLIAFCRICGCGRVKETLS